MNIKVAEIRGALFILGRSALVYLCRLLSSISKITPVLCSLGIQYITGRSFSLVLILNLNVFEYSTFSLIISHVFTFDLL